MAFLPVPQNTALARDVDVHMYVSSQQFPRKSSSHIRCPNLKVCFGTSQSDSIRFTVTLHLKNYYFIILQNSVNLHRHTVKSSFKKCHKLSLFQVTAAPFCRHRVTDDVDKPSVVQLKANRCDQSLKTPQPDFHHVERL